MSEVRTVAAQGLAKLLLAGRIMAPKLISRLLLLWYNPLTEDDIMLRHCLGTFFPVYAFASVYVSLLLDVFQGRRKDFFKRGGGGLNVTF